MPRADLLALSADDLAILSNRGVVKRASREVEEGEVAVELAEGIDGEIVAKWSDGVECRLPPGKVVQDGRCTCSSTDVCRHIIRTVLAYQRQAVAPTEEKPSAWDPGSIGDDSLALAFKPAVLTKARQTFDDGLLVELVRGVKPSARFHVPMHTVRFLVPGDVRYTHCDCAEAAPCRHVPLAVWAFRRLDPAVPSGFVTTGKTEFPVPTETLDDLESALLEWAEVGTAGHPRGWADRLTRLHTRCVAEGLAWPAEGVDDLARQFERYLAHDALFDPDRVVDLAGELAIRSDAIRSGTVAVPQVLIRGSASDRPTEVGSARYMGLGCGVRVGRKSVEVASYLQDIATGTIVSVGRDFADPPAGSPDLPREFWRLALTPAVKGANLAALGAGQLMIHGGKRSPGNRLVVGRGRSVVNPQAFTWEQALPPVLAEDFLELRARLALLPPASLRPRRVGEDFHVVPIAAVEASGFDAVSQSVRAMLRDTRGEFAELEHPSESRGREGVEALLSRLAAQPDALRFVAGRARLGGRGLVIAPVAVVFQDSSTGSRDVVQPWIDRTAAGASSGTAVDLPNRPVDPIDEYLRQIQIAMGELFVLGLSRSDSQTAAQWRELARLGQAIGFHRLARPVAVLADELDRKRLAPRWDPKPAARLAIELTALARLASDLGA